MRADNKDIKKQSAFCLMLAERLNDDIQSQNDKWLDKFTRHKSDAIRLRRELLKLCKMFEWEWKEK